MATLADRLANIGYQGLFLRLPPAAPALWAEDGMPASLAALAADSGVAGVTRFLAAEVIAAQGGAKPGPSLAGSYAEALRLTRLGNPWGLPGEFDTAPARHMLGFGEAAIAALWPLLGDARAIRYAGSEDATLGNAAGWRIQDFAASMIAAIRGDRFEAGAPPAVRDVAIRRLAGAR